MPFRSEAQRRYMWSKHPEIAKRWTDKYGSKIVKKIKKYKRIVDNKMKWHGETDYDKMKVKINKSKKKNKAKGEILDTIVHERQHIKHPKKHEKTVKKDTTKEISKMSKKEQAKAYALFKKKRRA